MIKVTIIGTGNVSFHLQKAFSRSKNVHLVQVLPGRSDFGTLLSRNDSYNTYINNTDVLIIAVSDDAVVKVAQFFRECDTLIVHTSGSVSINDISTEIRKGVFYPLQTFSKERELNFNTVPICLEANNSKDMKLLKKLADSISDTIYEINSEQRKALHLAAVFVNNFTNHLYQIGDEICQENGLSFDLLKPLIFETAAKIETLKPKNAQTGPAIRKDTKTIKSHLEQLKTIEQHKLYSILTQSIQKTYGEKL